MIRATVFALMAVVLAIVVTFSPNNAQAQSLNSLFPGGNEGTDAEEDRISDIMREAAENGVGVIVIGPDGTIMASQGSEAAATASTAPTVEGSGLMAAQDRVVRFRDALVERLLDLPNAINEVVYILRATSPDGTIWAFFRALYISLLLFGVGMLVEKFIYGRFIARPIVVARSKDSPKGYSQKMPFLVFRFFMGVIGILVAMATAYIIGGIIFGPLDDPGMQFTVTSINAAYFLSRVVSQLWRMILSPYLPQYRVPYLETRDAVRLYVWLVVLATFDVCSSLFVTWIAELGLNYDVYAFLASMLSAMLVLLNVAMILANGRAISSAIRLGKPVDTVSWSLRTLSNVWAPVVILYLFFAWGTLTYELVLGTPPVVPLIAGAYIILMSILVVYGVINFVIERSFARARAMREMNEARMSAAASGSFDAFGPDDGDYGDDGDDEGGGAVSRARVLFNSRNQMGTYEALARRIAGILALVAGINAFFYIWDNDGAKMVESTASQFLDILAILFLGYIAFHAFRIWIDHKISEEQGEMEEGELGDEGGGTSASRLATLLPLFRNFILVILVVTIALIVLMEAGVNVGPLFAGAGVVGVAVGFGSQALVRDIFSGGFFLFDDAFRKGEYLDVGGVKGTVEKISVRSFQLRHHLGALHTIPFGEIQVMTNYSRDWVIMKLPLRVTYDTDVEKVRKLIKNLGVTLLDDPVIGENFIQPLKSQGVIEMQDSAMIIRVKFMTKPGDQWLVRKKVYEEIRALFEQEGINFAHREVTVRLAGDKSPDELTEQDKKAVTAAAQAAMDDDQPGGSAPQKGDDR
ncbi:MAG: mechanosensitive ion channel family protein [Roseobacter sp.]